MTVTLKKAASGLPERIYKAILFLGYIAILNSCATKIPQCKPSSSIVSVDSITSFWLQTGDINEGMLRAAITDSGFELMISKHDESSRDLRRRATDRMNLNQRGKFLRSTSYATRQWPATRRWYPTLDNGWIHTQEVSEQTNYTNDGIIAKFDQNLMLQWSRRVNGMDYIQFSLTDDCGFFMLNFTEEVDEIGHIDILGTRILKFSGKGQYREHILKGVKYTQIHFLNSETFLAISGTNKRDTLFLSKTNLNGKIFWKRAYSPPYHHGYLSKILAHPDGGFVLVGMNGGDLVANIHDHTDKATFAWIKKVDSTGVLEWSHQIRDVRGWGGCTIEKDGSIVLALLKLSLPPITKKPQTWIRLMSYAADGSLNWDKNTSMIHGYDLQVSDFLSNPAGGWLLTGTTFDFRKRKKKGLLVAKYNPEGELIGNPIYDSYQIKQESQTSEYGWAYVDVIFQPGDIEKTFSVSQWQDVDSIRQTIVIEGQVYLYDETEKSLSYQDEEPQIIESESVDITETVVRRHIEKHYLKP